MSEHQRGGSTRKVSSVLGAGLGATLATGFLFSKLADEVFQRPVRRLDRDGVRLTRSAENPVLDRIMTGFTSAGEPWTLYPVSGLVAWRWWSEDRAADSATLALAVGGSAMLNGVLKRVIKRPRPKFKIHRSDASGSSFPSSHNSMSLATYGAIVYLAARHGRRLERRLALRLWVLVFVLCALIGWSRVYEGVHYPTDVLGGWAIGALWLSTCLVARSFMS